MAFAMGVTSLLSSSCVSGGGGDRIIDAGSRRCRPDGGRRVVDVSGRVVAVAVVSSSSGGRGCAGMVVHVVSVAVFMSSLPSCLCLLRCQCWWSWSWLCRCRWRGGGGSCVVIVVLGVTAVCVRRCKEVMSNSGYIKYKVYHVIIVEGMGVGAGAGARCVIVVVRVLVLEVG